MAILSRETGAVRPGGLLAALLDRVRSRGGVYFPELGPDPAVRIESARRPAYSELHQIALRGAGGRERHLVLKRFPGAPTQFRALESVWPHFAGHPQWAVPRPLDLWDEGPTLVMEYVPGRSLQAVLPRLSWAGPRLSTAHRGCQLAGRWLRFYHDLAAEAEAAPLNAGAKRSALEDSLEALVRVGFERALCLRVGAGADRLVGRAAEQPLPVSHVHGEFTVDNVLIHERQIIALDLWATNRDSVAHDLASFLSSLTLLRLTRPLPWPALARLRRAFLTGYFGRAVRTPAPVALLEMMGLADSALEIVERRRSALARVWVRRIVTTALQRIGAEAAARDPAPSSRRP